MADVPFMRRALELACQGQGRVEPNPMVGCVLVQNDQVVGEGFHRQFGGPHAEIEALRSAGNRAGAATLGATAYVTLEPCSHYGKTPPCCEAIVAAGIRRVVVAMRDPNPAVNGRGIDFLRRNGIEVTENILEREARDLLAPYLTLLEKQRPWIIAKWAMTLDGRTASRTGDSRWISGEQSRLIVHRLRGRVDAILVGTGTLRTDDPSLTVRLPAGEEQARTPLRVALDGRAEISMQSRLVKTANETPVLIVVGDEAEPEKIEQLRRAGCEVLQVHSEPGTERDMVFRQRLERLLRTLAEREMTNLLVEGGSQVFGLLFDLRLIDEVHAFIAPKLIGGSQAVPVIAGRGLAEMEFPCRLIAPQVSTVDGDIYVCARTEMG